MNGHEKIDSEAARILGIDQNGNRLENRGSLRSLAKIGEHQELNVPENVRNKFKSFIESERKIQGRIDRIDETALFWVRGDENDVYRAYFAWDLSSHEDYPKFERVASVWLVDSFFRGNFNFVRYDFSHDYEGKRFATRLTLSEDEIRFKFDLRGDYFKIMYSEGVLAEIVYRAVDTVSIGKGESYFRYHNFNVLPLLRYDENNIQVSYDYHPLPSGKGRITSELRGRKNKVIITARGTPDVYEKIEDDEKMTITKCEKSTNKTLSRISIPKQANFDQVKSLVLNQFLLKNPLILPSEFPKDENGDAVDLDSWRRKDFFEILGIVWERGDDTG